MCKAGAVVKKKGNVISTLREEVTRQFIDRGRVLPVPPFSIPMTKGQDRASEQLKGQ